MPSNRLVINFKSAPAKTHTNRRVKTMMISGKKRQGSVKMRYPVTTGYLTSSHRCTSLQAANDHLSKLNIYNIWSAVFYDAKGDAHEMDISAPKNAVKKAVFLKGKKIK